jgi:hypothetical protein
MSTVPAVAFSVSKSTMAVDLAVDSMSNSPFYQDYHIPLRHQRIVKSILGLSETENAFETSPFSEKVVFEPTHFHVLAFIVPLLGNNEKHSVSLVLKEFFTHVLLTDKNASLVSMKLSPKTGNPIFVDRTVNIPTDDDAGLFIDGTSQTGKGHLRFSAMIYSKKSLSQLKARDGWLRQWLDRNQVHINPFELSTPFSKTTVLGYIFHKHSKGPDERRVAYTEFLAESFSLEGEEKIPEFQLLPSTLRPSSSSNKTVSSVFQVSAASKDIKRVSELLQQYLPFHVEKPFFQSMQDWKAKPEFQGTLVADQVKWNSRNDLLIVKDVRSIDQCDFINPDTQQTDNLESYLIHTVRGGLTDENLFLSMQVVGISSPVLELVAKSHLAAESKSWAKRGRVEIANALNSEEFEMVFAYPDRVRRELKKVSKWKPHSNHGSRPNPALTTFIEFLTKRDEEEAGKQPCDLPIPSRMAKKSKILIGMPVQDEISNLTNGSPRPSSSRRGAPPGTSTARRVKTVLSKEDRGTKRSSPSTDDSEKTIATVASSESDSSTPKTGALIPILPSADESHASSLSCPSEFSALLADLRLSSKKSEERLEEVSALVDLRLKESDERLKEVSDTADARFLTMHTMMHEMQKAMNQILEGGNVQAARIGDDTALATTATDVSVRADTVVDVLDSVSKPFTDSTGKPAAEYEPNRTATQRKKDKKERAKARKLEALSSRIAQQEVGGSSSVLTLCENKQEKKQEATRAALNVKFFRTSTAPSSAPLASILEEAIPLPMNVTGGGNGDDDEFTISQKKRVRSSPSKSPQKVSTNSPGAPCTKRKSVGNDDRNPFAPLFESDDYMDKAYGECVDICQALEFSLPESPSYTTMIGADEMIEFEGVELFPTDSTTAESSSSSQEEMSGLARK